jgi:hypothetical protein
MERDHHFIPGAILFGKKSGVRRISVALNHTPAGWPG